jgi:prepilin-type N-terminal cleavage/methylation domain-containing protein
MRKKNAFTLIELVLVVALISILAGMATIRFAQSFRERSAEHLVKELVFFLRFVQFKAIEEGKTYKLVFESDSGKLRSFVRSPKSTRFEEVSIPMIGRLQEPGHFNFELEQGSELYFFPDGSVTPNQLMILEENQEKASIGIKNRLGLFEVAQHD